MTYIVNYTNDNKNPILLQNQEINESTSIKLVGKNYPGYGKLIAENFVHLLEHFSDSIPPSNPTEGQLWYNSTNEVISVYTATNEWKPLSNINISTTNPVSGSSNSPGNIWVNIANNKIFFYTGVSWLEVSTTVEGNGVFLKTRFDTQNNPHTVLETYVNFEIMTIVSSDQTDWVPQNIGANIEYIFSTGVKLIDQFPIIKHGINFNYIKEHGINSNGNIIAKSASGPWIASQQDITTVPLINNKIMTPFVSRKAYEHYVDGKIRYDVYHKDAADVLITEQDTWITVNTQTIDVFVDYPVFYSYNIVMLPRAVTRTGFRLFSSTNDIPVYSSIFNYDTPRTPEIHTVMSEHYMFFSPITQTAELQLQVKIIGTDIIVAPSHIISVSRPFEDI